MERVLERLGRQVGELGFIFSSRLSNLSILFVLFVDLFVFPFVFLSRYLSVYLSVFPFIYYFESAVGGE